MTKVAYAGWSGRKGGASVAGREKNRNEAVAGQRDTMAMRGDRRLRQGDQVRQERSGTAAVPDQAGCCRL